MSSEYKDDSGSCDVNSYLEALRASELCAEHLTACISANRGREKMKPVLTPGILRGELATVEGDKRGSKKVHIRN